MKKTYVPVFVYGTLKEGFPLNAHWMDGAKKVGTDALTGYVLVSFGVYPIMGKLHPAVVTTDGAAFDCCVLGEVWQVPIDTFNAVKEMEEAAGYRCDTVVTDSGQRVNAFVYFDVVDGAYSWQHTQDRGHAMRAPVGDVVIQPMNDLPF